VKRIRRLGLGVAMALALTATAGVATASASGGFAADTYPAAVNASGGQFKLTAGAWTKECASPVLNATMKGPVHSLSLGQTKAGACGSGGSVNMNGCQLILHPSTQTAEIGPSGCSPITVLSSCGQISIPAQTGIPLTYAGYHYADGIDVVTGVKVSGTVTLSGLASFCLGTTKGTLTANWNFVITNESKEIGLGAFRDYTPIGISLTNEKHPRTTAQVFPVNLAAHPAGETVTVVEKLGSASMNLKCKTADLGGGELTKEAESVFSLSGAYGGDFSGGKYCTSSFGYMTVNMNSCSYSLPEIEQIGGIYTVKGTAISCSKAEDAITLSIGGNGCTIRIPPQALAGTVTNAGWGMGAEIELDLSTTGLEYETVQAFLCSAMFGIKAKGTDGVMNQELSIGGRLAG